MGSYPDEFPFNIMDVVELLHLRIRRQQSNSVYVDCPFCGDRRGKMNVNFVKNVWRCNYCGEHGGMLGLYARLNNTTTSDAYWEIAEALCDNCHEEHIRSGNEAPKLAVSTGSSLSGARADAGRHSTSERKTVPQSEKASPAEIHQTLSLLLAQLTLRPAHREHLRSPKRGLSDEQIESLGFKSTPPPFLCRSITARLIQMGCKVEGVPGFYRDDCGYWTMAFYKKTSGILIPAVGFDGRLQGFQIMLDKPYAIRITDVVCYPQAYAAAATMLHTLMDDPKAVVLDIGGFTADYLLLKNGKADLTSCDSLENGVILLYNKIRSRGNSELDLLLDESDVDAILAGRKTSYPAEAVRLVERLAQEFVNDLFSTLRERMLDLRYSKVVFVGGGAILLRRQIEASGKVGTPLFVTNINANAAGFEYLYRLETAGR